MKKQPPKPRPLTGADLARQSEERGLLEREFVGGIIAFSVGQRSPYLAADALAVCSPAYLVSNQHKAVLEAIERLAIRGEHIDLVTVAEQIKRDAAGTALSVRPEVFAEWAREANTTMFGETSVMRAAEAIAAAWRKDEAAIFLADAARDLQIFNQPLDLAQDKIRQAAEVLDSGGKSRQPGLSELLADHVAALGERNARKPIKTPWDCVNTILRGGVKPGELIILAARPSVGKSAFALNWAWSVACSGMRVPFLSLEMGTEQLLDRLLANCGGVDLGLFRQGLPESTARQVAAVAGQIGDKPLDVIDNTGITVREGRRLVRIAQRRKEKVGMLVVDYLGLVTPEDGRVPREQQVAAISRGFKLLAKDLGIPVLLLAQLSRKGEDQNREPRLSDLRESGAIEQDADIVIFLHQARKRTWHSDEPVKFIIAKGRSSGVGTGHLVFKRKIQRFEESSEAAFKQAEQEEHEQHWSETEQEPLI